MNNEATQSRRKKEWETMYVALSQPLHCQAEDMTP